MKPIFLTLLSCFFLFSCSDDDMFKDYTEENEQEILDYLSQNNLNATKDEYGLYYIIDEPGTGLQPDYTDVVTVSYDGYFTDGTSFDQSDEDGIVVSLSQVISGWTIGIPYFKEGGSGKLIIPSRLAYGSSDYNGISGGSVLVFDVNLLSVNYNKENDEEITEYIAENNLTDFYKTETGLYVIVEEQGDGLNPTSTDNVTVKYSGYYTDGEVFDETGNESVSFDLQNLIAGWKEGLPYFKEGGKGKLLIPSRLGYGSYYNGSVPGGSVLVFDIELVSVN